MSLRYLTRRNALAATTQNPATTNFNHLRSLPRAWLIRRTKHDPKLKSVRPADRIKWWNIVPGDHIRLRGDKTSTLHEVLSINRLSNRVFLKNTATAPTEAGAPPPQSKNYHYSRCQLFIDQRELPSPNDPTGPSTLQSVFALRVGTSEPRWDHNQKRFVWRRYAVATTPKLPNWRPGSRLRIPWPAFVKRTYPAGGLYDTTAHQVAKITYRMPAFEPSPLADLPVLPKESEYLDHIYNPHLGVRYDPSAPFEVYLKPDLANPHSRAKKLERWKVSQAIIHARLREMTAEELRNRDGRTERQAKADAAFKWREQVKAEQAQKKKARWMHSAQMKSWERKNAKKQKKEDRQRRRLTELMLDNEPNQVIPAALKKQRVRA